MFHDGSDPDYEIRHFSCAERALIKAHLVARAQHRRARLLRRSTAIAIAPLALLRRGRQKLIAVVRTAICLVLARQKRLKDLRQLAEMSDLELKDIGITRAEIRAAVQSGARWQPYGLRACSTTEAARGDKHAKSPLGCPRLGS